MSKLSKIQKCIAAFTVVFFLALASMASVSMATDDEPKFELQCDGNVCCSINTSSGEVGDCEKV